MTRRLQVRLNTKTARTSLPDRAEPYWQVISPGSAIGYRKGKRGGRWIARFRDELGKQHYQALGAADDDAEPNGTTILSFSEAQEKARLFFRQNFHDEVSKGPYSVADAIKDYFKARERRGSKGLKADKYAAEARIIPTLGAIPISKLTTKRLRQWLSDLASAPKLQRTSKFASTKNLKPVNSSDPDALRARCATANRLLTILKAALNHAYHDGIITQDETWRRVKPFKNADTAVIRYLATDECVRLVNACEASFRNIVRAAILTGCRYGELARMECNDFQRDSKSVVVRISKSGKPRHVFLNDEGFRFFEQMVAGRSGKSRIFTREDGKVWGPSHQQRPLVAACAIAKIEPAVTFHILRHTYASTLAMAGCPMLTIAAQLGHADTRMCEKHYAHLAPNYVASTIRSTLPDFGIVEANTNILTMCHKT